MTQDKALADAIAQDEDWDNDELIVKTKPKPKLVSEAESNDDPLNKKLFNYEDPKVQVPSSKPKVVVLDVEEQKQRQ